MPSNPHSPGGVGAAAVVVHRTGFELSAVDHAVAALFRARREPVDVLGAHEATLECAGATAAIARIGVAIVTLLSATHCHVAVATHGIASHEAGRVVV